MQVQLSARGMRTQHRGQHAKQLVALSPGQRPMPLRGCLRSPDSTQALLGLLWVVRPPQRWTVVSGLLSTKGPAGVSFTKEAGRQWVGVQRRQLRQAQ